MESQPMDDVYDSPSMLEVLPRSERPTSCTTTTSMRKKRWVIVVGDALLRGTEGPICWTDPPFREVCCLPGVLVKDVARKLPSQVRSSDYYPLLLFHVGGDEAISHNPRSIKRDLRTLEQLVRESRAQVIFSTLLPVVGSDIGRNRQAQSINTRLRVWCHCHSFGFLNNGMAYMSLGLLASDAIHLS